MNNKAILKNYLKYLVAMKQSYDLRETITTTSAQPALRTYRYRWGENFAGSASAYQTGLLHPPMKKVSGIVYWWIHKHEKMCMLNAMS